MRELVNDPEITSPDIRTIPTATPTDGIGVVEAPRGTLFHHYETDEQRAHHEGQPDRGDAEQRGAHRHERGEGGQGPDPEGKVTDGLLNKVEMAFRAYDPCLGCATHSLPGRDAADRLDP